MKKIIWLVVVAVILILVAVFYRDSNTKEGMIKIGLVGPFSGNSAFFGEYMQQGLDLAKEELSSEELSRIQIVKEDDVCTGKSAISAVQKLINVDHVNYVIGPLCNESSLATEELFEDNKIVSLTVGLPSNDIANMGPYHFSFSPEIEYLMKTIADEMLSQNLKKVAIIHTVSAFEDENYKHFVKYFTAGGGVVVVDEAQNKVTPDFKTAVLKVKQAKPDSLMVIAVTGDLNNILKQLNDQGLGILPKFSIHAAETGILLEIKDIAEGLIYPYPADKSQNLSAKSFNDLFLKKYDVNSNPYSANVYDSFKILLGAIKKCGYEQKVCVQKELASLTNYQGANGSLSVDERGVGTYKEIMLKVVKGGKFETFTKNAKQ